MTSLYVAVAVFLAATLVWAGRVAHAWHASRLSDARVRCREDGLPLEQADDIYGYTWRDVVKSTFDNVVVWLAFLIAALVVAGSFLGPTVTVWLLVGLAAACFTLSLYLGNGTSACVPAVPLLFILGIVLVFAAGLLAITTWTLVYF